MQENASMLMDTLRLTYGAGVVLKLGGVARLELNYCIPVKIQPGDRYDSFAEYSLHMCISNIIPYNIIIYSQILISHLL